MGLLPPGLRARSGRIGFEGRDLLAEKPAALRALRGRRIGMIFQEPMTALNPCMRVGAQIAEVMEVHGQADASRVLQLLEQVHLPDPPRLLRSYPHALSGGQRQRVMIAMALALEPSRADRRRADHGARRHDADADPAADPRAAGQARHRRAVHHA